MSLNFVRRKNGRDMATVAIKFHMGSVEIAQILAGMSDHKPDFLSVPYGEDPIPGKDVSRAAAEDEIRTWLWLRGKGAFEPEEDGWPSDDTRADEALVIAEWAAAQVRRLFPQLDDAELAKWLKSFHDWVAAERRKRARWREETGSDEGFEAADEAGYIEDPGES